MPDPNDLKRYCAYRACRNIAVALSTTLAIVLIAFGTVFMSSQPSATQVAEAKPRLTEPLFDKQAAIAYYDDPVVVDQPSNEELAHTNAKYLATFLALGRYEGLEGAQPLYEEMLASLGINFLDYSSLAAEIEAVSSSLEAAPDLWQSFADQTIASGLLPV